jgi:hypothetical protein
MTLLIIHLILSTRKPHQYQMESARWRYSDALKRKFKEGNSISFCVCHRNANPELQTLLMVMFRCVLQLTPVNERFSELWL